jgi:hypothetical protein
MVCQKTGDPRIQLSSYFPVFWLGYGQGWLHPHDKNLYLHDSNPYISFYLVGGIPTPLKNMKVSWDDEIPNRWKNKFMFQITNQFIYPFIMYSYGTDFWPRIAMVQ